VSEREFVAVLGPSGSGKTTLFRCVTGCSRPDRARWRRGPRRSTLRGRERRHIAWCSRVQPGEPAFGFDNVLAGRLGYVAAWRGLARPSRAGRCRPRLPPIAWACRARRQAPHPFRRPAAARRDRARLAQEPDIIVRRRAGRELDRHQRGILGSCSASAARAYRSFAGLHQCISRSSSDRIVGLSHGNVASQPRRLLRREA